MNDTDLILEIIGIGNSLPPFSARECTQTLTPIAQGALRRTINGKLVCIGNTEHRKFQSIITCKDKASPALSGIWKGALLRVGCLQTLTQNVPQGISRLQLAREPLAFHLYESSGKSYPVEKTEDRWVLIPDSFPGGFITYHPLLLMVVKNYHLETDEWGFDVGWKLELEEQ
ncbi:MAG TPA: hypothetical protein VMW10_12395 [Alphaproteobacteria bacterium]|nr:hypothetical protein [Alphaproteobacteria bacterium]